MDQLNNACGYSVSVFRSKDELVQAASEFILGTAAEAIKHKGEFTFVLSGGNTPADLYRFLAEQYSTEFPWYKTYFFWGDERCVPPEDKRSNYRMAYEAMLGPAGVPEEHTLRIKGELGKDTGAVDYEKQLQDFSSFNNEIPVFDCVLLGMGRDGHTASLFPDSRGLSEKKRLVIPVSGPDHIEPHIDRISLTLPVLKAAKTALFLVSGASKAESLRRILDGDASLPAGAAARGNNVFWYITDNCLLS